MFQGPQAPRLSRVPTTTLVANEPAVARSLVAPSMRQLKLTARVTGRPATVTGRAPMWRHAQSDSEAGGPPGRPARPGGGSSAVASWACPPGRQLALAPGNPGPGPSSWAPRLSHDGQPGRARPQTPGRSPCRAFKPGQQKSRASVARWLWPFMLEAT